MTCRSTKQSKLTVAFS